MAENDVISIDDLPEEIWIRIFLALSDPKEICRASRVSQKWRRMTEDEGLWQSMWIAHYQCDKSRSRSCSGGNCSQQNSKERETKLKQIIRTIFHKKEEETGEGEMHHQNHNHNHSSSPSSPREFHCIHHEHHSHSHSHHKLIPPEEKALDSPLEFSPGDEVLLEDCPFSMENMESFTWRHSFLKQYSPFYAQNWHEGGNANIIVVTSETKKIVSGRELDIQGEIWLRVKKPVPTKNISVKFRCMEKNYVYELGIKKTAGVQTFHYVNRKLGVFVKDMVIDPRKLQDDMILPGEWRFPFKFQYKGAPLPSTYFRSSSATVRCFLEAKMNVPGFFQRSSKSFHYFKVVQNVDMESLYHVKMVQEISKTFTGRGNRGELNIKLSSPHNFFLPGETVKFSLQITNGSSQVLSTATINLLEFMCSSSFTKALGDWTPLDRYWFINYMFRPIEPGETRRLTLTFDIPPTVLPSLSTTITRVSHLFRFTISERVFNITISMPVTILEPE